MTQTDVKLASFLPRLPECWDYKHAPSHPAEIHWWPPSMTYSRLAVRFFCHTLFNQSNQFNLPLSLWIVQFASLSYKMPQFYLMNIFKSNTLNKHSQKQSYYLKIIRDFFQISGKNSLLTLNVLKILIKIKWFTTKILKRKTAHSPCEKRTGWILKPPPFFNRWGSCSKW